ncbi:MAG: Lrp/AsnC ligand binding domain-containing protein [Thaumarchaeota archaeon]|nr:Lrp/AsnC ligand binding domain-containing protein [Nitrososphaerota archaeon]
MPTAFVLINCDLGMEKDIVKELKKIAGVKEVHEIYGVYDIIAKLEAEDMRMLREAVMGRIRKINGVRSTLTMTVIE